MEKTIKKEYYALFLSVFRALIKSHFGWRDIILLFLSLVIGTSGSYLWKGEDFMSEQFFSFVVYSIFPFGVLALGYVVYFIIQTPVEIYKSQINELDKYNFERINFDVEKYNIIGSSGWGLKVVNGKSISLNNVSAWLIGTRKGKEWEILEEKDQEKFLNVNERAEILQVEDCELLHGEKILFAITTMDSGIAGVRLATNKKLRFVSYDVEPLAIDVFVVAKTKFTDYELHSEIIRLDVFGDGKVSIRRRYGKEKN